MNIGFLGYVFVLFFLTGSLILLTDVKAYKNANLQKEQKASRFLGWLNLSFGAALMLIQWIYQQYIW